MGEESKKPNLNRIKDLFRLVEKETYVRSKGLIDLKMCEGFAYDVLYINPTKYELNYTRSADGFSLLHVAINKLNPYMVAVLIYLGADTEIKAKKSGITPEKLIEKIGHLGCNMQEAFSNAEGFLKECEIIDITSDVDSSDYVDDYNFDLELAMALEILDSGVNDVPVRPNSPTFEIDNIIKINDNGVGLVGDDLDN